MYFLHNFHIKKIKDHYVREFNGNLHIKIILSWRKLDFVQLLMYIIKICVDVIYGRFGNISIYIKLRKIFTPKLLTVSLGPCVDVSHN